VTAIGEAKPQNIVKRSGAKPGDLICCSGFLGGSYVGLLFLEREKKIYLESPNVQPDLEGEDYVIRRLLKPEARKDIIDFFEEKGIIPTAMMDISDGLSSELLHIAEQSGTGSVIYEEKIPIHEEMRRAAYKFEIDPTACALSGGEDYELLFTISQSDLDKLTLNEQISVIGYVTEAEKGNTIITKGGNVHAITAQGWNAFSK
jgi:thiamine-monophosphate kinase